MSANIHRLVTLVRADLERAAPIIETGRLDDLTRIWLEWRNEGLPASSMSTGGTAGGHSDPTAAAATTLDAGNKPHDDGIRALEQIDAGLRELIRLSKEAPASESTCHVCGKVNQPDTRRDRHDNKARSICGACRRRLHRRAA